MVPRSIPIAPSKTSSADMMEGREGEVGEEEMDEKAASRIDACHPKMEEKVIYMLA